MPRSIRFHRDESCDTAIADGLRLRGLDISTTQETGLRGASDERQLEYAYAEKRALICHELYPETLQRAGPVSEL
jgi:hypothetical protein